MTSLKIDTNIAPHLVAGRRAAYGVVLAKAAEIATATCTGATDSSYTGLGDITIDGLDIGPAIDAAVIETVVRLAHPDVPPVKHRKWWRFWA